jgi:lysophospholipase L1-like esterase
MDKYKLKQFFLNLVALFVGCLIFFLILEFVVRAGSLEGEVFITLDPCVGHINKPRISGVHVFADSSNFVEFNSRGFHDTEHLIDRKNNTYRILVLGDSFTEALQVKRSEMFSYLLEKNLNEMKLPVEVISLGISSYGTDQELMMYRCVGRLYKPDLVLLNFSANDSGDNYFKKSPYKPQFYLKNDELVLDHSYVSNIENRIAERTSLSLEGIAFWFKENSYAARYIKKKLDIISANKNAGNVKESPRNTVALLSSDNDEEQEKAWHLTEKLLEQLSKEVGIDGAKFLLIKIPGQPEFPDELKKIVSDSNNYDPELARKTLSQIANNISVPYLDLQEAIVGAGKFEDLYFPLDRHWKPEGHVVAARTVADFIIKKDLLK